MAPHSLAPPRFMDLTQGRKWRRGGRAAFFANFATMICWYWSSEVQIPPNLARYLTNKSSIRASGFAVGSRVCGFAAKTEQSTWKPNGATRCPRFVQEDDWSAATTSVGHGNSGWVVVVGCSWTMAMGSSWLFCGCVAFMALPCFAYLSI